MTPTEAVLVLVAALASFLYASTQRRLSALERDVERLGERGER